MALNGLEKITGRIISDAENDAAAILKAAEEKSAAINAEYAGKAEALKASYEEKTNLECENIILKAKSSLDTICNNIMLTKRAEIIDTAFTEAMHDLCNLPKDKYAEMIESSLNRALKLQIASEKENMELYGEDTTPELYEVILSKHDRAEYGSSLVAAVKKSGGFEKAVLDKLTLSDKYADIRGGLVLKCGDIELNCSFEMILSEIRGELEPKVEKILFPEAE